MKKIIIVILASLVALLLVGVAYMNNLEIVDKASMWLETAKLEIAENEELSKQQSKKIINYLDELIDNKKLRTDLEFQESFIQEIEVLNYSKAAVLSLEKVNIRVSSPLNYHEGYWVAKIKPPGSPFKISVINDLHIDPYTRRVTVYAQSQLFGKVVAPAQVGLGEYATDKDGNKIAHHPNSVYLNGSGQELLEADGTGEWWVKHSWVLDGEGYTNWELKPEEDYGQGTWVNGIILDDGITMKIGTLDTTNSEKLWGFNTRVPKFDDNKLTYEVIRWEYLDDDTEPTKIFTLDWNYKQSKSAFDNQVRKPMGQ